MPVTQRYKLNIVPEGTPVVVHASQYDAQSRDFYFTIYNGSELFEIPSGSAVTVRGTKPDNTGFEYSATYSGSLVHVIVEAQMTVLPGNVRSEIRITNGAQILGTANFILRVESAGLSDETQISETEIPLIEKAAAAGALASQVGNNTSAINTLSARMDEFTRLPDGSTTGDAELADIRIWYDGKESETAGESVRGQASQIDDFLEKYRNDNDNNTKVLEDLKNDRQVEFTWERGWFSSDGKLYPHTYSFTTEGYIDTAFIDSVSVFDTATYNAHVNYYDKNKNYQKSVNITNNQTLQIEKEYPYIKVLFYYKSKTGTISESELNNILLEKTNKAVNVINDNFNSVDNLISSNGTWNFKPLFEIGGLRLDASFIGQKIKTNAGLTRARTTVPMYIRHDFGVVKTDYQGTYQFSYALVDEEDTLIEYGDYARNMPLSKGKYYFSFKKKDNSNFTNEDLETLITLFDGYYYFDDNTRKIEYSKLFCRNNYVESDGVVRYGQANWNSDAVQSLIIPNFYTDHDIFIQLVNPEYKWRDTVSDENDNIVYSTGYIANTDTIKVQSGYHHIMVSNNKAQSVSFADMEQALNIFATLSEIQMLDDKDIDSKVITRNYDMQNALYALRKSYRWGNNLDQTVFIAHPTDTHSDVPRWENFIEAVEYYKPDICLHTGDLVRVHYLDDHTYLTDNLPSMPMLLAIGNHETGINRAIGAGGATNQTLFNDLIEPLNEKYNIGATKTYYSYDLKGIRFICLNVYDFDENDGTTFTDRGHIYYSQAQVDWFIQTLQDANANDIPVVICAHESDAYLAPSAGGETPFNQTYELERGYSKIWSGNPICDIIEAFINGTNVSDTYDENGYITLNVNTTFAKKGHFVTWLMGHRHADYMGFLPNYSQLCICACATACSVVSKNSAGGYSDLPRYEGMRAEDAFNFYAINTRLKTIGLVRFGSNINFDLRERNFFVASYEKKVGVGGL